MNRLVKLFTVFALAALIVVPASAQDAQKKKKKKGAARQPQQIAALMKKLEGAGVEEAQMVKIKAVAAEFTGKLKEISAKRREGIGGDVMKKMSAARKEAASAGKKGKELQEATMAVLTDEQKAIYSETQKAQAEVTGKLRAAVIEIIGAEKAKELKLGGRKRGKKKKTS